jgi:hypothetical protein
MPTRPDTLQGSLPLLVLTVLHRRGPLRRRQLGIEEARWRSVTDAVNYVLKHV